MQHDPRAYLADMQESAELIVRYTLDVSMQDYDKDLMLKDAVERRFIIIGEALNQLRHKSPAIADEIEDHTEIRAFRNVLVHQYHSIKPSLVYGITRDHLPKLIQQLDELINRL